MTRNLSFKICALIICGLIFLHSLTGKAVAQNFTAQGLLTTKLYSPFHGEALDDEGDGVQLFEVEVNGPIWRIKTHPIRSTPFGTTHTYAYSDGKNVSLNEISYSNGVVKRMWETVDLGAKPVYGTEMLLWFGFCSSHYLKTNKDTMPYIWQTQDALRAAGDRLSFKLENAEAATGLPQKLTISHPSYQLREDGRGNVIKLPLPAPHHRGYVQYAFNVVTSTNMSGQTLPLALQGERFTHINPDRASKELFRFAIYTANVTNYVLGKADPKHPDLARSRSVKDLRFTFTPYRVPVVEYEHSGGPVPEMTDPNLLQKVRVAPRVRYPAITPKKTTP